MKFSKWHNILVIKKNEILTKILQEKEREVTKWNLCFVIQMVYAVTEAAAVMMNV